jgi:citrate lyase subunit beta / citryl-CoA lyase
LPLTRMPLYFHSMQEPPLDGIHLLPTLPPCEHMAGNEKFIRKALGLQHLYLDPQGRSLVDVTIDLEDGAPVGSEEALREVALQMLRSPENKFRQLGVRVHPFSSEQFSLDISKIVAQAADTVAYITIPKIQGVDELRRAWAYIQQQIPHCSIPVHALIETAQAVSDVDAIAAQPFVQVLDFGLMDLISLLGGAIHSDNMKSPGQFDHKLLASVKEKICFAALKYGKVPAHNVCIELSDMSAAYRDAKRAHDQFGFLRMWSIHPEQIPHIINALVPTESEVAEARRILAAGESAQWGPTKIDGRLHDRASYRYYWGVVSRSSTK